MTTPRWLAVLAVAAAAGAAVVRARFVAVKVDGPSMEPALSAGDWVLIRRVRPDRVRHGQIVVLAHPGETAPGHPPWLIKRAVALSGDEVPDWIPGTTATRVPPGALVILGDNRDASFDSRLAGFFPADTLLGVVVRRLSLS